MALFLFKITYQFYSNYIQTVPGNTNFLKEINKFKNLERGVAVNNPNEFERFRKKWHRIENQVPQDIIRNKQKKKKIFMNFYESKEGGKMR